MRARAPFPRNARLIVVAAAVLAASIGGSVACTPRCQKLKAALDDVRITSEDVARINSLVAKRKAAIAEAAEGEQDTFSLEKLQFSVTGYELAVETQLRVVKISPKFDNSPLYEEYRNVFDAMRCDLDALAEDPGRHKISNAEGSEIRAWSQRVGAILRNEGKLSPGELSGYLEEGIVDEKDKGEGEE
jgi:hypothetical protein